MFFAVCGVAPLCRPSLSSTVNAPSPFLLFFFFIYFINLLDTRLRFALTAYSSLKHSLKSVSLSHTHRYTRYTPLPKKNTLLQLHRWGEHSYRMRFVSKRAPMAVWGVWFEKYEWRFGFVGNSSSFFLHFFFCSSAESCFREINKDMDYSLCLFLLLATVSSESSGQFPTSQMWVLYSWKQPVGFLK